MAYGTAIPPDGEREFGGVERGETTACRRRCALAEARESRPGAFDRWPRRKRLWPDRKHDLYVLLCNEQRRPRREKRSNRQPRIEHIRLLARPKFNSGAHRDSRRAIRGRRRLGPGVSEQRRSDRRKVHTGPCERRGR